MVVAIFLLTTTIREMKGQSITEKERKREKERESGGECHRKRKKERIRGIGGNLRKQCIIHTSRLKNTNARRPFVEMSFPCSSKRCSLQIF